MTTKSYQRLLLSASVLLVTATGATLAHAQAVNTFPTPTASSASLWHHGGAGRRAVVHRSWRQQDRPDFADGGHHHRIPHPYGRCRSRRDHDGAGRQPLVRRIYRQQDRPHHPCTA